MVKFICDFSFITHYVENFFATHNKESAEIINHAITCCLDGEKLLIVSKELVSQSNEIYKDRPLVLDTIFDVCEISNLVGSDSKDTLQKIAMISNLKDKTYLISEDEFIKNALKNSVEVLSINEALKIIKK